MADTPTTTDRKTYAAFEAAYYDYVRELEGTGQELTQGVTAAHNDARTSQLQPPEPSADPKAAHEAQEKLARAYCEAICSAWEGSQRRYASAYFGFLDSFGHAWAGAERSHMSPPALAAIAQCIAAVASHASATIGNTDVFAWTGVPMPAAGDSKTPAHS